MRRKKRKSKMPLPIIFRQLKTSRSKPTLFTLKTVLQNIRRNCDFDDIDLPHAYRLRLPKETQTYELNKFSPGGELYQLDDFKKVFDDNSVKQIAYEVNLKTDPDPF